MTFEGSTALGDVEPPARSVLTRHVDETEKREAFRLQLVERLVELNRRVNREHHIASHGRFFIAPNLYTEAVYNGTLGPERTLCGFPIEVDYHLNDDQIVWRLEVRA